MPVFETPGGSRLQMQVPSVEWPELKEAVEKYRALENQLKATRKLMGELVRQREQTDRHGIVALKEAIVDGKAEESVVASFDKKVTEIEKKQRVCKQKVEALDIAMDDASVAIIEAVDDNREEWRAEIAPQ